MATAAEPIFAPLRGSQLEDFGRPSATAFQLGAGLLAKASDVLKLLELEGPPPSSRLAAIRAAAQGVRLVLEAAAGVFEDLIGKPFNLTGANALHTLKAVVAWTLSVVSEIATTVADDSDEDIYRAVLDMRETVREPVR